MHLQNKSNSSEKSSVRRVRISTRSFNGTSSTNDEVSEADFCLHPHPGPSRSDAEDILQETSLTVCEKFKDFELGTNFYSWACQIAYWKRKSRSKKKFATSKVVFNQEVLDVISQTRSQMEDELDIRHEALSRCLQKLNDRDRRMVLTRYESGKNVSAAAQACGRTVQRLTKP